MPSGFRPLLHPARLREAPRVAELREGLLEELVELYHSCVLTTTALDGSVRPKRVALRFISLRRGRDYAEIYCRGDQPRLIAHAAFDFCFWMGALSTQPIPRAVPRVSEIDHLAWEHINFERNFAEIESSKVRTKARRLVPLHEALKFRLQPYRRDFAPDQPLAYMGLRFVPRPQVIANRLHTSGETFEVLLGFTDSFEARIGKGDSAPSEVY